MNHSKMKALPQALLAALIMTPMAFAQAQTPSAQKVEKIEVTGSNIKRVDAETAAPIQIITAEDLRKSGVTTISEALRNLPVANAGSLNDLGTSGSFAIGSSSISLRGLGASATLVLLNGRRLANYGLANGGQQQFVNLDTIPFSAIERIEILKDGASAIYGSEAMAGVINVILRRDYVGLQAAGSYSINSDSEYKTWRASGTYGFGDLAKDRFNVLLNLDHYERERTTFRQSEPFLQRPEYQQFFGTGTALSSFAIPGNYRRIAGTNTAVIPAGGLAAPGCTPVVGTGCLYDQFAEIDTVPKAKRDTFFLKATWDIRENLSVFAEASFSKNNTVFQSAPAILGEANTNWFNINTLAFNRINLTFAPGNPNNPYAFPVGFRHRFAELGNTRTTVDTEAKRAVVGLRGVTGAWDWEVGAVHMTSNTDVQYFGRLRASVLRPLIANGGYNFINPSANSAATLAAVSPSPTSVGNSKMQLIDAKGSTELMQMANGPLALATGLEYRKETLKADPDNLFKTADIVGVGASSASGDRNVTSMYAELSVPILKNVETQLAIRRDKFSDYGSSTTPKFGIKWKVTPELALRATSAKGFRAPSLPEISKSFSAGFYNGLVDTRRCPTTGASTDCNASVPVLFGANPGVLPEKSSSGTVGAVWDATKDLSFTYDLYRIRRTNEIGLLDPEFLIANEQRYPGIITRGPVDVAGIPGPLVSFQSRYFNLGDTTVRGMDFSAKYNMNLGEGGKLKWTFDGNYITSYKNSANAGEEAVEYNGTYNQPKIRGNASVSWEYQDWIITPSVSYIGKFLNIGTPFGTCPVAGIADYVCTVSSMTARNITVQNESIKNLTLSFNIRNIGNNKPALDINQPTRMYNTTYQNPYGLYMTFAAIYKFK